MNYQITISFSNDDLRYVQSSGYMLCIAKSVSNFPGTAAALIGWMSIMPYLSNTFHWTDDYIVYESDTPLTAGATIDMGAAIAAQVGMAYTYEDGGFAQSVGRSPIYFDAVNQQADGSLNFGLAQQITDSNGKLVVAPIYGIPVGFGQSASFLPTETVSIFLSQTFRSSQGGVVLGAIPANAAVVTVSAGSTVMLVYNPGTGGFAVAA